LLERIIAVAIMNILQYVLQKGEEAKKKKRNLQSEQFKIIKENLREKNTHYSPKNCRLLCQPLILRKSRVVRYLLR